MVTLSMGKHLPSPAHVSLSTGLQERKVVFAGWKGKYGACSPKAGGEEENPVSVLSARLFFGLKKQKSYQQLCCD